MPRRKLLPFQLNLDSVARAPNGGTIECANRLLLFRGFDAEGAKIVGTFQLPKCFCHPFGVERVGVMIGVADAPDRGMRVVCRACSGRGDCEPSGGRESPKALRRLAEPSDLGAAAD
jgi:hypothetical protein